MKIENSCKFWNRQLYTNRTVFDRFAAIRAKKVVCNVVPKITSAIIKYRFLDIIISSLFNVRQDRFQIIICLNIDTYVCKFKRWPNFLKMESGYFLTCILSFSWLKEEFRPTQMPPIVKIWSLTSNLWSKNQSQGFRILIAQDLKKHP